MAGYTIFVILFCRFRDKGNERSGKDMFKDSLSEGLKHEISSDEEYVYRLVA